MDLLLCTLHRLKNVETQVVPWKAINRQKRGFHTEKTIYKELSPRELEHVGKMGQF